MITFVREMCARCVSLKSGNIGGLLLLFWCVAVSADKDSSRSYGSQMPTNAAEVPIDQAINDFESSAESVERKFSGRITEVCKKKGCWMVLSERQSYARVTFENYRFFVPTDSNQAKAIVYGTLNRKKLNREVATHYEKDVGRRPTNHSDKFEYRIVAKSVVINN